MPLTVTAALLDRGVPKQVLAPRARLSPVVKWLGGKSRLLPELVARLPATCSRYYEPFAGGAALYLHLEPENALLADTNADLTNVYWQVAHDVDAVVQDLELLANQHSARFYIQLRDQWNAACGRRATTWGAAAFLYLNKTCFNGLWRVNRDGEFNVPMGDYKNPRIVNASALRAAAPAFARASLLTRDFRMAVAGAQEGDFVYFDPPYIPSSPTAQFTTYTPGGFGEAQHLELAATARALAVRGVQVMVSNSDTPLTRELYRGFAIDRVLRAGTINSDTSRRGPVGELIITGDYARGTLAAQNTPPISAAA